MIRKPGFGRDYNVHLPCKQWVASAIGLLLALSLQCFDVRAELLFRSLEQVDGEQRWSPVRHYGTPSDTTYPHATQSGETARAEEVRVYLSGDITRADVESAKVLERLIESGKQKIAGNTVWLAGNGGDIDAAMEVGRRLRRLGIFTIVDRNEQCLSACVFAYMGGERRHVAGRLGIHRPYFPFTDGTPDRQARFRELQRILRAYIVELDFPDSLYEAVMLVPPESMQIVSAADLKRFYLEGISPSSEDRIDAAAARGLNLSMLEYLKRKATTPACAFLDAGAGRCDGKVQDAAVGGGTADDPENIRTGEAAPTERADSNPAGLLIRVRESPGVNPRDPT